MPSFDIVSKVDLQEIDNIVNSVQREIGNRYDFKNVLFEMEFNRKEAKITVNTASDYNLEQVQNALKTFAVRRGIDPRSFDLQTPEKSSGNNLRQVIGIKQGIDKETAKNLVKLIKDTKFKVQASICEDEVRVSGKKIDDLQAVIQFLKERQDLELPLQYINFRS